MISSVELDRRTWNAAVKLAVTVSLIGVLVAMVAERAADVPQFAIVLPVMIIGFVASWVQTGRVRRAEAPVRREHIHA